MMKIILIILICFPMIAISQQKDLTDSTEFRYGLPISNDDTVKRTSTTEERAKQWSTVTMSKIPVKLRKTLQKNSVYEGWERGEVFYDKNIDRYMVRIRDENAVRTYGFTAGGSPVTFTEEEVVAGDSIN